MHHILKKLACTAIVGIVGSVVQIASPTANATDTDNLYTIIWVVESEPGHTLLQAQFPQPSFSDVEIHGESWVKFDGIDGEVWDFNKGQPDICSTSRSLRIPNKKRMHVEVTNAEWYEMDGIQLAPTKGPISREIHPDQVPYEFGEQYQKDEFWPPSPAALTDPWIMRDQRGIDVKVTPFQYNPVSRKLRVYTAMELLVYAEGEDDVNTLAADARSGNRLCWSQLYKETFINYEPFDPGSIIIPFAPEMLVITPEDWADEIQPLVDHRNANGIWTYVRHIEDIGNNPVSIKNYINNQWLWYDISYVLLVGDYEHVTSQLITLSGTGGTDPDYGFLAGSDCKPEVLVGRFSAQTDADVETQVERTINYEGQFFTSWRNKGLGVGSSQGAGAGDDGQSDKEHLDAIRNVLLGSTYYNVDQVYDPTATDTAVKNSIEAKLGVINYTGHGSSTSWSSSGFNNADVDALTNTWNLPWIISVACVNGQFHNASDCFAERWLRATDTAGKPTGAVAAFMSTVNQSWAPPMEAQDVIADETAAGTIKRFANLCAAGTASMNSKYGTAGDDMTRTWTIFGDPALNLQKRNLTMSPILWPHWHLELEAISDLDPRLMELSNDSEFPKLVEVLWAEEWLHVEPSVVMLQPGESVDVMIMMDLDFAADMEPGEHTASLVVHDMMEGTADQGSLARLDVVDGCAADINGDGGVDILDLLDVLQSWGSCTGCNADINDDGSVDILDLLSVLADWNSC